MSDVVFILGAGASHMAGAPLMRNFLDTASDLLRRNNVDNKQKDFQRVFDAIGQLQVVHSKAELDLNNLESVFTVLELAKVIKSFPGSTETDVFETIASLKTLIVTTLEKTVVFPCEAGRTSAPPPYGEFANFIKHLMTQASPRRSVSVITFNYDVAVDWAIHEARLGPDYAIEGDPGNADAVSLLKLHGSLNWGFEPITRAIKPLRIEKYNAYREPSLGSQKRTVVIGSQLAQILKQCGTTVAPEPLIVPPSWNKADYHHDLSAVWASAAKHLSEAQYIFIIGYSLPETDAFFRHLYALGSVGREPLRRIEVFNTDESQYTDERFRRLLGPGALARYAYHKNTFAMAIPAIREYFK